MTKELEYLLKAITSLADALAYLGHVRELRNGADMELINEAKHQIMRAYDRCTFLHEVLK